MTERRNYGRTVALVNNKGVVEATTSAVNPGAAKGNKGRGEAVNTRFLPSKILVAAFYWKGCNLWVKGGVMRARMAWVGVGALILMAILLSVCVQNVHAFSVGYVGTLIGAPHSNVTVVAITAEAMEEFGKAVIAGDKEGIAELEMRGLLAIVKNGTKARVIGYGSMFSGCIKVRVLDGESRGISGFISDDAIK